MRVPASVSAPGLAGRVRRSPSTSCPAISNVLALAEACRSSAPSLRGIDRRTAGRRRSGRHTAGRRTADLHTVGRFPVGPRTAPRNADLRSSDRRAAAPHTAARRTAAHLRSVASPQNAAHGHRIAARPRSVRAVGSAGGSACHERHCGPARAMVREQRSSADRSGARAQDTRCLALPL